MSVADLFFDAEERAALVHDAAARLNVAPWVVEKDLWICWMLARLQEMADLPTLTFKGGTSLSKVHRLVDRFSEDIDLTFSREGWGFEGERDPLHDGLSGKRRQALVDEVAARSTAVVRELVLPGLIAACQTALGEQPWSVILDSHDPQAVFFAFPAPTSSYGYGPPVVKAEFGARGDPWPTSRRVLRPYLEELHPGIAPTAVVEVATLDPERTFWEKATLLHALHHATLARPDKHTDRLSRHIYDLHRMWSHPDLKASLLHSSSLLDAVVHNKKVFFKDGKARYELVEERLLNATPHMDLEGKLRGDYADMASMFFPGSAVPTFDELMTSLREIDATVASWRS